MIRRRPSPVARRPSLEASPVPAGPAHDVPLDATDVAVLDAVVDLLLEVDHGRWSVDDVAERAGVGRTSVYRCFDSRDRLVHEALGREIRRYLLDIAAEVADVADVGERIVEGVLVGMPSTTPSAPAPPSEPSSGRCWRRRRPVPDRRALRDGASYNATMNGTWSAKVSHRGQTNLPAELRRRWGVEAGGDVGIIDLGGAALIVPGDLEEVRAELRRVLLERYELGLAQIDDPDLVDQ